MGTPAAACLALRASGAVVMTGDGINLFRYAPDRSSGQELLVDVGV